VRLGCSDRYRRAVKGSVTGQQEVRLDAASRQLVQSNASIEDITHAVGYADISSFIRLFKRRTNYSPSNYRARFRALHVPRP